MADAMKWHSPEVSPWLVEYEEQEEENEEYEDEEEEYEKVIVVKLWNRYNSLLKSSVQDKLKQEGLGFDW